MAASPVKFLLGFLLASFILWLVFMFALRLFAWILSRLMGASVGFRIGGWMCLRDVVVKFKKGVVESVSVGEIRLSLRQSLVKLGVGFISRDPKLQVLICHLQVVLRPSGRSTQKIRSRKSHTSSRGKWRVVANVARYLSASISELVVKMPRATIAVKELRAGLSKDGGSKPALFVKLHLLHILGHLGGPWVNYDQASNFNRGGNTSASPTFFALLETNPAPFYCTELILSSEFRHDGEAGVVIKNVDILSGEVTLNLTEELVHRKKFSSDTCSHAAEVASSTTKESRIKQAALLSVKMKKCISMIPEKLYFNLPKLDVKFVHRRHDLVVENNIMGIQVEIIKERSMEEVGESTRLDIRMDFNEIHLLREASISVLEILKLGVVSSAYIPSQHDLPIRYESDVKLGDTQCNIILSRLKPWMRLRSSKGEKMVLQDGSSNPGRLHSTESKGIIWSCTVSAPEMTAMLYSLSGSPLYLGCSQSAHLFANNISSTGTSVHMELGELNLHTAGEYEDCLKESLFGVETNTGCIMNITTASLDWGRKDMESLEKDGPKSKVVLSVEVTGVGVYLTFKRIESLLSTVISFKYLLKLFSASSTKPPPNRGGHPSEPSGKGIQRLIFRLDKCSINFSGEMGLENTVIADPKRVNYGSQGGRVIVILSADGAPRSANIMSTISDECKKLKYCISLDIFQFSTSMDREKQSTQMELERARSIYQEYLDDDRSGAICALFDMQNAKLLRSGGLKEITIRYLFSATDIAIRWEPDVHIALFELVLQVKLLIHNHKFQGFDEIPMENTSSVRGNEQKKETSVETIQYGKQKKKRESIFVVDLEMLSISAEVGDGVDAMVQVQSIFTENASIGVVLEGLVLSFNDARVFKSSRIQISRIPNVSAGSSDAEVGAATSWDWVIQGLDVHICMPYRLQLRAIDDSIEEMLRALKLITAAKAKIVFPMKKDSAKPKQPSSTKFGCVKLCIHKLTVDIEEEPLQGWLDEHYQLMKNEASELSVRLKFLDELISRSRQCSGTAEAKDSAHDGEILFSVGEEIDVRNASVVQKEEEIYKQSFQSYYQACQNLVPSDGSGACKRGFQSGFKPSTSRTSLLSIYALELDVSLTSIIGGDDGMLEVIQQLDPVSREFNIPFSRLYGSTVLLRMCSLVVQLRNYTLPLFSGSSGSCEGRVVLAQQATCFQPQIYQNVFIGRWRKVRMLRSATGTTPPMKTYLDLPIHFQKTDVAFGVGFEPAFADISYAFTVALRRANLSMRNPNSFDVQPPRKERSLPWWDDMRNYIHGNITLFMSETRWNLLATTDPYEKCDKLQILSCHMEIQQSDGRVYLSVKDFKILLSTLETFLNNCNLKLPIGMSDALLEAPSFTLEVTMEWDCESGNPINHYLFALPHEGVPREKVFDPFRSTSLSLRWDFSLRPSLPSSEDQSLSSTMRDDAIVSGATYGKIFRSEYVSTDSATMVVGAHDLVWLIKFWNMNFIPPHKLRTFSRWPRFGIPRVSRSGNLSLERVMTEFMFRIDVTPICIRHMPLDDNDPAKGLKFKMSKLKCELYFGRGKQTYTFECMRDPLDLVYLGVDLNMLKASLSKEDCMSVAKAIQISRKNPTYVPMGKATNEKRSYTSSCTEKNSDDGFLLSSDYFLIRRQAAKADPARLSAWQEAGRRNLEMTYIRSEFENESKSNDHTGSDPSDDDYNVAIADNCLRIFVYGLKLLWNFENRDAVCSWIAVISKAFEPPKLSPSRLYAQRKLNEGKQVVNGPEMPQDDSTNPPLINQGGSSPTPMLVVTSGSPSSLTQEVKRENSPSGAVANNGSNHDSEEEGTRHFMVNIVEPQFNLHSEDSNGRFLLAADSGRVLARSFHSVLHIGYEIIGQALGAGNLHVPECQPEMTWNRKEFSVMLEHVQAHVAPTDVDPGAGLQWLPKIRRSSPNRKRTGALLERVFVPCDMYFRYTRHNGGTTDLKMKPLKELSFNSRNLTATMTSRQYQVMLDVLTNLLFARLPKPRKTSLSYLAEDDEGIEEADEVVPEGVEEVELARINLEQKEREQKMILDDIRKLSSSSDTSGDESLEKEGDLWMITGGRSTLVYMLKKELGNAKNLRKTATASLRMALHNAAQLILMEKEKNKSPSCAMRISVQVNKVIWSMLADGKCFVEAEINDMKYEFDRDFKDIAVARFTIKYFVVRNCLPNAKFDMLLSPWNPPPEWGKKVMLQVDARQGAPKVGNTPFENFQVDIYPLKIHLTETLYHMIWGYLFPEEQQDYQRRQEVWKVSTASGPKSVKKVSSLAEAFASSSPPTKEPEVSSKPNPFLVPFISGIRKSSLHADSSQTSKLQNRKDKGGGSTPDLRRTSSFDRTWEENVAESVANELVLQVHSSGISPSKSGSLSLEQPDELTENKSKEMKPIRPGRSSLKAKKVGKRTDDKLSKPRKMRTFHNVKISQVELLVSYEGPPLSITELRLLMDAFHLVDFTGTWGRLFSRVKKHVIWGVLKSVTGMQGKKFKYKGHAQEESSRAAASDINLNLADSDQGSVEKPGQYQISWARRSSDGAGDGFVTSVKGLFNSQRRKAKALVLRTMRSQTENRSNGEWSENDAEFSPFARQLTITNAKKLIRRHTKKFGSKGQKGVSSQHKELLPSSSRQTTLPESDSSSSGSPPYEDFHE
ncbi:protein SABRE-like isoform X1 [Rhododendron vialii]|uniref:protein SABRE-like isoform X1 n=1 Tax=Rhododendron vialii TaxID=182163 RepID=UPI00266057A2|nr:protein SABRE-like isoform X1 [Rhododendron vialii]